LISSLNGKIIFKDLNTCIIECGGIGFKAMITNSAYSKLGNVGEDTFLYTFLSVKEDALDLYGFSSIDELETFKLITSVSGVGPKIGIALLNEFTFDKITLLIASADAKSLTAASGVGLKLAQRIILELKDKIGSIGSSADINEVVKIGNATGNNSAKEAIEALVSLGYTQSEASLAVSRLDTTLETDKLIKSALKTLAKGF